MNREAGKRKVATVGLLVSLFLSGSASVLGFEPFPGNWVEVTRFEGTGYQTGHFTCENPEWRIKWDLTATHMAFHFPDKLKFSVTTTGQDNSHGDYILQCQENSYIVNKIEPIQFAKSEIEIINENTYTLIPISNAKSGISIINDHIGSFNIIIESNYLVESYSIIIEQNIDSIPEFPSWTILIIGFFSIAPLSIVFRHRFKQLRKNEVS